MINVTESDMIFGPFAEENLYHIEKSESYIAIQNGMKMAEFVVLLNEKKKIVVLEAKTSSPNPNTENNKDRFDEFISEIEQKLSNALDSFVNQALKSNVPDNFKKVDYNTISVVFVLVIKKHPADWLVPIKEALETVINKHLRFSRVWKCNILVLNEDQARGAGLVV